MNVFEFFNYFFLFGPFVLLEYFLLFGSPIALIFLGQGVEKLDIALLHAHSFISLGMVPFLLG